MKKLPKYECVDVYNAETGCMESVIQRREPRPRAVAKHTTKELLRIDCGDAAPEMLMRRFAV